MARLGETDQNERQAWTAQQAVLLQSRLIAMAACVSVLIGVKEEEKKDVVDRSHCLTV